MVKDGPIVVMKCSEQGFIVQNAAAMWAISLKTAQNQPVCVTLNLAALRFIPTKRDES